MSSEETDNRLVALSSLVQFEQELRRAENARSLAYIAVNDARRVVDFRQAVFWHEDEFRRVRIQAASNISEVDHNAPAIRNLVALSEWVRESLDQSEPATFSLGDCDRESARGAEGFLAPRLVHVPLFSPGGAPSGGIIFAADHGWSEGQLMLLSLIGDAVSHAWNALGHGGGVGRIKAHLSRTWKRYLVVMVVLFLLPVRQYVLAPAEVIPQRPQVVAAPMDGVVASVHVQPNDEVEQGQLLFRMEDTDLSNRYILAQRSLEVAEAEYLSNAQQAFQCDECRGRVPELRAVKEREEAEVAWARAQLGRSNVEAPAEGIVAFTDVNDWEGRPVNTGQRVMTVSHPDYTRLRINLPVDDAIQLEPGAEVRFYPNVDPLSSHRATLQSASYEARELGDSTLAFPLLAGFDEQPYPRLGLRGTAKIYGDRAPLIYLALRKPLSWLRRTLGF